MRAAGEKSACAMTVRGWAEVWRGLRCALGERHAEANLIRQVVADLFQGPHKLGSG